MRQPAATALSMTASSSASAATTKTQRMPAGGRTNWRGKYLRALNISTPEVDVVSRKKQPASATSASSTSRRAAAAAADASKSVTFSHSFDTSSERDGDPEFQSARANRYQMPSQARYSSHRRALQQNSSSSANGYGFALKPDLARGRRCHTDPFESGSASASGVAMATAPIQIPSAARSELLHSLGGRLSDVDGATMANTSHKKSGGSRRAFGSKSPVRSSNNNNRSSNNFSSNQDATAGKLLSWEEPAVMMLGAAKQTTTAGSALGGLDIAFGSVQIHGDAAGRGVSGVSDDALCDEFVETEDEGDGDSDSQDSDSDGGDDEIFEMEDFDSDNSMSVGGGDNNNSSSMLNSSKNSKSRSRRRRTASASQVIDPSPSSKRNSALPRYHSVRQMRANGTLSSPAGAMELPESFVPPHQLIQRDCFSIGLRDEFKRRQPKI